MPKMNPTEGVFVDILKYQIIYLSDLLMNLFLDKT